MLATSILTVSLLSSSKTPKRRIWRCAIWLVDAKFWGSDVYRVNNGNRPNRLVALFWSPKPLNGLKDSLFLNLVGAPKHFVYCSMVQSQHLGKSLLHTFRVSFDEMLRHQNLRGASLSSLDGHFPRTNEQMSNCLGVVRTKELKPMYQTEQAFSWTFDVFWMGFIPNTSPPKGTFWRCCSFSQGGICSVPQRVTEKTPLVVS